APDVAHHADRALHEVAPPLFPLGHLRPALEGGHAVELGQQPELRRTERVLRHEYLDVEAAGPPVGQELLLEERLQHPGLDLRLERLDVPHASGHHGSNSCKEPTSSGPPASAADPATSGSRRLLILLTAAAASSSGTGSSATTSAPAIPIRRIHSAQCSAGPTAAIASTMPSVTWSTGMRPCPYSPLSSTTTSSGIPASFVSGFTPPAPRYSATSGRTRSRPAWRVSARARKR